MIYAVIQIDKTDSLNSDIRKANSDHYMIFIGVSAYAFEGMSIIMPIKDTWQNKKNYFKILFAVMVTLLFVFLVFGLLNYAVYGEQALIDSPLVTSALPKGNIIIEFSLLLYMINIVISYPLAIFPANKVIETCLYGEEGKINMNHSLKINRTILVVSTIAIGLYFEEKLDRVMCIVGTLGWIPLAFIFPAIFHIRLHARNKKQICLDLLIIILGLCIVFYVTGKIIFTWKHND